MIKFL